ncbi:hypothetical protein Ade02nite_06090 [Paractinoplanes deccanensis]|uniref:Maltokinase N-terminal cap domain-containing protein n=1 Tax=Paractinoplanes deccanensis TaxID=113561 RepID=A0ABQ3XW40_9ACTN|nr:hypothetical protein [Actinoplanes deccanensis]GID71968.1 hypothetical protein Ade02nite_06090 [Actinoplanes deccanensis]
MALIHRAQISPTKLELLEAWLPAREWFGGESGAGLERVAAYRFDDPDGEVGIETLLVRVGDGPVFQVPLTYRGAPLDGAEAWLVGTCEHSVLGQRWVYDATGDPVYAAALTRAILGGEGQAEEFFEVDGVREPRPLSMTIVAGGPDGGGVPAVGRIERTVPGEPTLIVTDTVELAVIRRLGASATRDGVSLRGSWSGQSDLLPLAFATRR